MSVDAVMQVRAYLLERSMFDEQVFQSAEVLTSAGIQRRYQEAIKKRLKNVARESCLLCSRLPIRGEWETRRRGREGREDEGIYPQEKDVQVQIPGDRVPGELKERKPGGADVLKKRVAALSVENRGGSDVREPGGGDVPETS
nr:MAG TPA: protein of unknown function (DUF4373) [Caudoviricetes sp.]